MLLVINHNVLFIVRLIGLEPTRLSTPDPKSGASTNFATGAGVLLTQSPKRLCKGSTYF